MKYKAFDFFSCGGGASLGMQQAGFDIIGFNEIDPKIARFHQANIKTKFDYICDIREMLKMDLPQELHNLDLAHFSFPCTSFSNGKQNKEESWGVAKKFAEGQIEQTLDDLGFISCDMVAKIKPKVVTMENVKGLTQGRAKVEYLDKIIQKLKDVGYIVEYSVINATTFDVPQNRNRLIIIAQRKDIFKNYINLINEAKVIPFSTIQDNADKVGEGLPKCFQYAWDNKIKKDKTIADVYKRVENKNKLFDYKFQHSDKTLHTITANRDRIILYDYPRRINKIELIRGQTFPEDYNFLDASLSKIHWLIGMSVPPKMMEGICRIIKNNVFEKK